MKDLANTIVSLFGLNDADLKKYSFCYSDLIELLLLGGSIKIVAECLDIKEDTLESIIRRKLRKYFPEKSIKEHWDIFLLYQLDLKKCTKCNQVLDISEFSLDNSKYNRLHCICKYCDSKKASMYRENNADIRREYSKEHYLNNKKYYIHKNAIRRARKIQATPLWANLEKIKEIYAKCPEGYHVDHILPLKSTWVCGLHVEHNLQYLLASENLQKSNKNTEAQPDWRRERS